MKTITLSQFKKVSDLVDQANAAKQKGFMYEFYSTCDCIVSVLNSLGYEGIKAHYALNELLSV